MEDLNGLDWSAPSSINNSGRGSADTAKCYPALRQNSASQNYSNTLSISFQNTSNGNFVPKSSTVLNPKPKTVDSFSNLVSFGAAKEVSLSLQERKQKLEAERQKQDAEERKQLELQFGNGQSWDEIGHKNLGQTHTSSFTQSDISALKFSPVVTQKSISQPAANESIVAGSEDDEDLFAAFNSETKVDASSHYPPPLISSQQPSKPLDLNKPQAWMPLETSSSIDLGEDDDPFGLNQLNPENSVTQSPSTITNDDDLLGDLGKPVEEVIKKTISKPTYSSKQKIEVDENYNWNKAVSELVEMGFTAEKAQHALIENGQGINIQAAVSWLLNDAHRQSQKNQQKNKFSRNREAKESSHIDDLERKNVPRICDERDLSQEFNQKSLSPSGDLDIPKTVTDVRNNLVKSANSLWKISQKKVQKVVADFQQQDMTSDSHQPKWMREACNHNLPGGIPKNGQQEDIYHPTGITHEALLLEGRSGPSNSKTRASEDKNFNPNVSRDQSSKTSKVSLESHHSGHPLQQSTPEVKRNRDLLANVQSENVYVSPARRKKMTSQPQLSRSDQGTPPSKLSTPASVPSPFTPKTSTTTPNRPKVTPRQLPPISPADLQLSTQYRLAGTSHFKRGDYVSAHSSYSSSLSTLPASHPINIVLLCNRALTSLKNGVPKSAISDANLALDLIGESRGDGEIIDLGSGIGGGKKEMKVFYEKAMLRKAEALEQMERWKDAGDVWKICVEQGVGGSTATEGRKRCGKLLNPKPLQTKTQRITPQNQHCVKPIKANTSNVNSEESPAVKRLREANEKAEITDNEKLELIDKVEARIALWRDGKKDNLRALIGSLGGVMWEGSGWKDVGMHELVQNNKVKINYMKAIGKTHPDKLPQNTSTEVRMTAALIFATLNESWDKFKQQNGM